MTMRPEFVGFSPNRAALDERLAKIDPKKIKAYREHRTVGSRNNWTKFYFEYSLWQRTRRGPPFVIEPPAAKDFHWPPKYEGETLGWNSTLKWEERGFKLVAHVVEDDSSDNSHLGEIWSNDRNRTYPDHRIKGDPIGMDYHEYDGEWVPRYWFVPQCDIDGERKAHRCDKTRHEAWLRAQNSLRWDYTRLEQYGNSWSSVGVEVKAYKHGIELGSASLWGIESDADAYLVETAHDLAEEAIREANGALEELLASKAEQQGAVLKTYIVKDYPDTHDTLDDEPYRFSGLWYVTVLEENAQEVKIVSWNAAGSTSWSARLRPADWKKIVVFVVAPYEPKENVDDQSAA
jgi:hypothetical protein